VKCDYFILLVVALFVLPACGGHKHSAGPAEPSKELLAEVPFAEPQEGTTEAWAQARRIFFEAYGLQLQGNLEKAVEQYQRSIEVFPTAEAYTFLGWTYSWMGWYEDAIEEARRAIAVDPEYGNPYNDIGVYLMYQGKLDEAIPWLKRAMKAKRYANPHFPWLNLGHIWVLKGEWGEALSSFEEMWRLAPDYPVPTVPALPATLFLPRPQGRNPGAIAEQRAVKEAVVQYFEAWNSHDADALKTWSNPLDTKVAETLLMHLAAAKRAGRTIATQDTWVLHLQEGTAVVGTTVTAGNGSKEIQHLLRRVNGTWKVVIRLDQIDEAPGGDSEHAPEREGSPL
jgi:tetratricopeptide (TPR) repeat protein